MLGALPGLSDQLVDKVVPKIIDLLSGWPLDLVQKVAALGVLCVLPLRGDTCGSGD